MGVFAEIFREKGSHIPQEKKEEFEKRLQKLLYHGGMMRTEVYPITDKGVTTIRIPEMGKHGIAFNYNYIEDYSWEYAGYDRDKGQLWCTKTGGDQFCKVMTAAYWLEAIYTGGRSAAMVNGDLAAPSQYMGWLNYLFDEQYPGGYPNLWGLFESMYADEDYKDTLERQDWFRMADLASGMRDYLEIIAVLHGTYISIREAERIPYISHGMEDMDFPEIMRNLKRAVSELSEAEGKGTEECLIELIRGQYEDHFTDRRDRIHSDSGQRFLYYLDLANMPAFAVAAISEDSGRDFWALWEKVRDVVRQRNEYRKYRRASPVRTRDFLHMWSDDRIYWWVENGDDRLSDEVLAWLQILRFQYDALPNPEPVSPEYRRRWILDLLEYANEHYYKIYAFADFLDETLLKLEDERIIRLWMLFEKLIHDPELKKAGEKIFDQEGRRFPDGTRRLVSIYWDFIPIKKKFNAGRVTLRRYLAFIANKKLRATIFGF